MKKKFPMIICLSLLGCSSSALVYEQLTPVKTENVSTVQDFLAIDTAGFKQEIPNADKILLLTGDSVFAACSLYELHDIFWLDIYFYNATSLPYFFDPEQFVLMDAYRTAFRRLEPHEVANIYLSYTQKVPAYQPKSFTNPKYAPNLQQWRLEQISELGNMAGAAMVARKNKEFAEMAGALYTRGFVSNASIPAQTGIFGGIYWLKNANYVSPVRLRLPESNYEVEFGRSPETQR